MTASPRSRLAWTLIAVGGVLLFLGAVNAYLGHVKSAEYVEVIALVESSANSRMSDDPTPDRTARRLDSAVRKLGFYRTVRRGGGWLAAAGAVLVLGGLLAALADSRRAQRTPQPAAAPDPPSAP